MRRFLENRISPRAVVWTYFTSLVAAGVAVLGVLGALALRYLPHDYLEKAGLRCASEASCGAALPPWADATFSFLLGGILLGLVSFGVYAFGSRVSCTRRHCEELDLAAEYVLRTVPRRLRGRVYVVDDDNPVSYTAGFLRPYVVVSSGLFESLDSEELEAVLAHEEGHIVARDNLLNLIAECFALTFVLVPGVRFAYGRMRRAQELAADAFAGKQTGDPVLVASSLHKFARSLFAAGGAGAATPAAAGAAFAEDAGSVSERIRDLLDDRVVRFSRRAFAAALLAIMLSFAVFSSSAVAVTGVDFFGTPDSPACHAPQGHGGLDEVCTAH